MLKCCKARRFDVIVARSCEWIASFDLDECSELRGIICKLVLMAVNANALPFNDKRDDGIAIADGIVSKPKLLSIDVDSSVVGDADCVIVCMCVTECMYGMYMMYWVWMHNK